MSQLILRGSRGWLLAAALLLAGPVAPLGRAQTAPDLPALRARADKSDPEAQNTLGNAYTNGLLGLRQNYAEALQWYRRAAEQGFAPAQFNLGLVYELGRGVPVDEREAFKHYMSAAEQGFGAALFNVGNMYAAGRGVTQDQFEANIWYRQAADKGLVEAQYNVGLAYEAGRGVKKDETQAARWYRQAAERGFPLALYNLGLLFEDGRGVAKDPATAAELYRAAASQGVALAQNNYGLMLFEGRGGQPRDPVEAMAWLSLAVENGVAPAALESVVPTLTPEQKSAAALRVGQLRSGVAALNAPAAAPAPATPPPAPVAVVTTPPKPRAPRPGDAPVTFKSKFTTEEPGPEDRIAILQKENARLNDELTRASREVVWLNQQHRASQAIETAAAEADKKARDLSGQLTDAQAEVSRLTGELNQARAAAPSAETDAQIRRLNQRVSELTAQLQQSRGTPQQPAGNSSASVAQLQQQVLALQADKAELEKWTGVLEKVLREKATTTPGTAPETGDLAAKLAQAQQQLAVNTTALEAELVRVRKLTADNRTLTDRARLAEEQLAAAGGPAEDLNRQLVALRQHSEKLTSEKEALGNILANEQAASREARSKISALEQAAAAAARQTGTAATAQARISELEGQLAVARNTTAPAAELAEANEAAAQLRSTVGELTKANARLQQQLTAARQTVAAGPSPDATGTLEARVRELEQERDRARREATQFEAQLQRTRETNSALTAANRQLLILGTRSDESPPAAAAGNASATSEQLAALTAQLARARQDLDAEQKRSAELATELAAGRQASAPAAPSNQAAATELARDRAKLEQEREEMRRLVDSYRQDIARLTQAARTAGQQRLDTERAGQQSADTLAAQVGQLRRDLETTRAAQGRQAEAVAAREREQAAMITQLRTENGALAARLNQAQGTLDQIANSVRLSVPGATVATVPAAVPLRYHTVADGDTLSKISLRYYGNASRWQEIYQANTAALQGSSALRVGQQLRIP